MSKFTFGIIIFYATVAGFIIDKLPVKIFEDISRDTRFYVLRLLGLQSKVLPSLLIALLLSGKMSTTLVKSQNLPYFQSYDSYCVHTLPATAAFSEELFFRGVVFRSIEFASTPSIALIASSALFGLAHVPIWGASSLVEAFIGGVLGYSYM